MKDNRKIICTVLAVAAIAALLVYLINGFPRQGSETGRIVGTITYGPTYPGPCRQGMDCSDKPFVGLIYVKTQDKSAKVTEFNTDPRGSFDVELKPGKYFLEVSKRFVSVCGADVAIEAGKVTNATFSCDTGIR